MGAGVDRRIAALAARQRGYVTRPQLLDLGLGNAAIKYRVAKGTLIPVHTGVYAVGHAPLAGADRACAAVLACGPGAVLSHASAASLWELDNRWKAPFEVIVETGRRRPGIRTHRAQLTGRDVRRHNGIRVTSPARTILDIAPGLTEKALKRGINELRIARRLRVADLAELLERRPRHPGASRVSALIHTSRGPTRSELEDAFLDLSTRFGLPLAEVNARVAGYEVDALFRAERVIVELDGYEFHRTRDAFERDRERDATTLAAGFETVRITWDRLQSSSAREAARLQAILSARRAA
jgi:Transcriptional regulator, AbiEi antitoxin/Protein of unknown function (DUF559)